MSFAWPFKSNRAYTRHRPLILLFQIADVLTPKKRTAGHVSLRDSTFEELRPNAGLYSKVLFLDPSLVANMELRGLARRTFRPWPCMQVVEAGLSFVAV